MTAQLALALPPRIAHGRADYFVSPANATALAAIDGWTGWPHGRMILAGPAGAGKTHLARVWAADARADVLDAASLAARDPHRLGTALVIEDAEQVAGRAAAEEALFHLVNLQQARRGHLLLTARLAPRDWGVALPDLLSRLQATALTRLAPPDDMLLANLLLKMFADRQVAVSPALIGWLVARMDRSFATARALVAELDARALASGGPIRREMARAALARLAAQDPEPT